MMVPLDNQVNAHMVAALNSGEQHAFDTIYHTYYQALCFFANRIIQNEQEAEDISQECMEKLWNARGQFKDAGHVKGFLYTVAYRACMNHFKRLKRMSGVDEDTELLPEPVNIEAEICRVEVVREVHSAIESLPPECRKIVRMSFVLKMRNKEIAAELNLAESTVKNQKTRGYKLLRRRLRNVFLLALACLTYLDK
jgi:RNA polymerase sigma-70 factor (family 1)